MILGMIGAISMLILSLEKDLYLGFALLLLTGGSAGAAIADVTIDACVTENSIAHPSLAGEMQSLCGLCSSIGQLVGFTISGFLVHRIGSKVCYYHIFIMGDLCNTFETSIKISTKLLPHDFVYIKWLIVLFRDD